MNDYLGTLNRQKVLIVLVAVVMAGAAYVITGKQAPEYTATSKMLVNQSPLAAIPNVAPSVSDPLESERLASTQMDLAQIPGVARAALRIARVQDLAPEQLLQHVVLTQEANADLIDVSVTATTPYLARHLSTAYANAFATYQAQTVRAQLARQLSGVEATIRSQLRSARDKAALTNSPSFQQLLSLGDDLAVARAAPPRSSSVVSAADSATQIAPKPGRNTALALVLGLLLGSGLAFLLDARDRRVRTTKEISALLHLNLLARIPSPARRWHKRPGPGVSMLSDPSGAYLEAIKMLQANLEFAHLHGTTQCVLFTSAVRGEGKSTTVANLAVSLAQSARNVVLVDADLRQPTLSRLFDVPTEFGLTELALEELSPDDITSLLADVKLDAALTPPSLRGSLRILPAGGRRGEQPDRLLSSPALSAVFSALRAGADWVLVDTPPMTEFYDAFMVSHYVDAVIALARLGYVQLGTLAELGRLLASSPVPAIGFVATGARGKSAAVYDLSGTDAGSHLQPQAAGARRA